MLLKIKIINSIIGRQIPESLPPQQTAPEPSSGPHDWFMCKPFLPQIISFPNQHHFPPKKTATALKWFN